MKLRTDSRRAPEPPTSAASTASGASRRVRTEEEPRGRARPEGRPSLARTSRGLVVVGEHFTFLLLVV